MANTTEYINALSEALQIRRDWLDKTELANLKENLRIYQLSFSSLYNIFLKKKLVSEDPYKQEAKIGEIEVPDTSAFNDTQRSEQISVRLSNFDNQLDFLVNYYQFGVEFLNLDRIKRILGLVRYIDWAHLVPETQNPNTRAVAEITNQSRTGLDPIALSVVNEALTKLPKTTSMVINILKNLTAYHKEVYKFNVRNAVTQNMTAAEANAANIRKKISAEMPGTPCYLELIEDLIKEDYSAQGPELRETILNSLKVKTEKPKAAKKAVSFKVFLTDGIRAIGGAASSLSEIIVKLDENETLLANLKKTFWEKVRLVFKHMVNANPDERIIEIEYTDPVKAVPVRQQINYHQFYSELEKKIRMLSTLGIQGSAAGRLDTMTEDQLASLLDKTIRDVQVLHRTLAALDEYYKAEAPKELRDRIRGVRPELAALKNSFVKANQLRHEYNAHKEEEDQMKRLGITQGA